MATATELADRYRRLSYLSNPSLREMEEISTILKVAESNSELSEAISEIERDSVQFWLSDSYDMDDVNKI